MESQQITHIENKLRKLYQLNGYCYTCDTKFYMHNNINSYCPQCEPKKMTTDSTVCKYCFKEMNLQPSPIYNHNIYVCQNNDCPTLKINAEAVKGADFFKDKKQRETSYDDNESSNYLDFGHIFTDEY